MKRVFSRGSKFGKTKNDSSLGELPPQETEATSTSIYAQSDQSDQSDTTSDNCEPCLIMPHKVCLPPISAVDESNYTNKFSLMPLTTTVQPTLSSPTDSVLVVNRELDSPSGARILWRQQPSSSRISSVPALNTQGTRRISLQDVAIVEHALRHDDICQIQGCHCYSIKALLGKTKLHKPYTMGSTIFGSNDSSGSNRSCDSGYGSGPIHHQYQNSHLENYAPHLHYPQVPTNHYSPHVDAEAPTYGIRSKQLSDLTPLLELPEQVEYQPIVSSTASSYKDLKRKISLMRKRPSSLRLVTDKNPHHPRYHHSVNSHICHKVSEKPGTVTPVYYHQPALGEEVTEKLTNDDRDQPVLLREISISAKNIPALCLNDCPFTPSPVEEDSRTLAATSGRTNSFQSRSMQSTNSKPQLKTVKEKISSIRNEAKEEESPSETKISSASTTKTNLDPKMQRCISPLSTKLISSSQISRHSSASALLYETEIQEQDGVITGMITDC